jgi:hypothetical protein
VGKSEGEISHRTHRRSWGDNIKIDIKMGWNGFNGIHLVEDKEKELL